MKTKHKERRKLWQIRHSRLYGEKRPAPLPKTQNVKETTYKEIRSQNPYSDKSGVLGVPKQVSITNNFDESIKFFKKIENKLMKFDECDELIIDLSGVEYVGVASLIYLLSVLYKARKKNHCCKVTILEPINDIPKLRMYNSGLAHYIKLFMNYDELPKIWNNDTKYVYQIVQGSKVDSGIAGSVCDWMHGLLDGFTIRDTKPIYEMLIELMSNTYTHSGKVHGENNWYLYSEKRENDFNFIFLDAGRGIPKTVRKTFQEKVNIKLNRTSISQNAPYNNRNIRNKSNYKMNDAILIESAFDGDFRTSTGQTHRGKGLPQIARILNLDAIHFGVVYSGRGRCEANKTTQKDSGVRFKLKFLQHSLDGTLYNWKMNIRR